MLTTLVILSCIAADPDPEPPASPLAQIQGRWSARMTSSKAAMKQPETFFTFEKGKLTISRGGLAPQTLTVTPDKSRKDVIETTPGDGGRATRFFFRFEKGELHLVPVLPGDPKPDFSGTRTSVTVLTREKK